MFMSLFFYKPQYFAGDSKGTARRAKNHPVNGFLVPGLAATLPQWRRESYRVEGSALPLLRDFSSFPLACAPGRKTRKERKPSVFIRSDAHVVRAGLEEAG